MNWFKIAQSKTITDFPSYVKENPYVSEEMEQFEEKVYNSSYAQDSDDLYDDMIQPGSMGTGLLNEEDKISGYIYGYTLIPEDNFQEVESRNITCLSDECSNINSFIKHIFKEGKKGNIFYVSNLAISEESRFNIHKIFVDFSTQMINSNYDYIAFEALPDTVNLLMQEDETVKTERIRRYGFEPICFIPFSDQYAFLLKINKNHRFAQTVMERNPESQPDLFDPLYNVNFNENYNISERIAELKKEIYDFLEYNEDAVIDDNPSIEIDEQQVRDDISENDSSERYMIDEDKQIFAHPIAMNEFLSLAEEALENIEESDERYFTISEHLNNLENWKPGYYSSNFIQDMEKIKEELNLEYEVKDLDDYFSEASSEEINDYIYENYGNSIEEDLVEREFEYWRERLDDLESEYSFLNFGKKYSKDISSFTYSILFDLTINEIEDVFESIQDKFIIFQDPEKITQILLKIKELKYLCLKDKGFYEEIFKETLGYDELFNSQKRKASENIIKSVFDRDKFNQAIRNIFDEQSMQVSLLKVDLEKLNIIIEQIDSNYRYGKKQLFETFYPYLVKKMKSSYVGSYEESFSIEKTIEDLYTNYQDKLKMMLINFVQEELSKKEFENAKELEEIGDCSFIDYGNKIKDYIHGFIINFGKEGEIFKEINITTPEGESISQRSIEEAKETCNKLAKEKQLTPEQINQYDQMFAEKELKASTEIKEFISSFLKDNPNIKNSFNKELETKFRESEILTIADIVQDFKKSFPESQIKIDDSYLIQEIFEESKKNTEDKDCIFPKLVFGVGLKTTKTDRKNWIRNNLPNFMREYGVKTSQLLYETFGSKPINPEQHVLNFARYNKIPRENIKIIAKDTFGVKIKIISTGEELFYNYPMPKFLSTWSENRIFNLGENQHDSLVSFYDEEVIKQPKLKGFLIGEMNTSKEELDLLLRLRGQAIENKSKKIGGIIPGSKAREEDEKDPTFPDNRDGVKEYQAKRKYNGTTGDVPRDIAVDYIHNLFTYGYDEKEIEDFFNKIKIPEIQTIEPINKKISRFVFKILEKADPLGSVLGNITGCCQKIGGIGESCMYDGYNNPDSGFLVVFDSKGKVAAQSWIRYGAPDANGERILYLDNIETVSGYSGNEELKKEYIEFSKFLKEERKYKNIICGERYSEITFPELNKQYMKKSKTTEFPNASPSVYSDLVGNNRVLANKLNWYKIAST